MIRGGSQKASVDEIIFLKIRRLPRLVSESCCLCPPKKRHFSTFCAFLENVLGGRLRT